jgi:putative photosynthetic complex assembly protein
VQAAPHVELIPRRALLAAGAALGVCVLAVGAVRLAGYAPRGPDAPAVAERALRFVDLPDGGIAIVDAASGAVIDTAQGEQGFLRGTLRGLLRERKRRGLGREAALLLIARADGRLTLTDPSTGERIDLESFGPTNAAVFARWLGPSLPRKAAS